MAVERRFDFQPTLTGTLLELRPVTANDWIPLRALGSDPLVWAGDLPPRRSLDHCESPGGW